MSIAPCTWPWCAANPDPAHPRWCAYTFRIPLSDVVGIQDSRLGWPLRSTIKLIAEEDCGVIVILRQNEGPRDLMTAVRELERGRDEHVIPHDRTRELKTFGTGAQILRALGVKRMRVLSAPKQMHAISGFGLEVVEYLSDETQAE